MHIVKRASTHLKEETALISSVFYYPDGLDGFLLSTADISNIKYILRVTLGVSDFECKSAFQIIFSIIARLCADL
jgi:hypothetical protein